jgi:hypothetical protein
MTGSCSGRGAILAMVLMSASIATGQETRTLIDGAVVRKPWDDVVGRRVVVEGLAWGAMEKGLGPRIVMDADRVYVRKVDLVKHKANGKLVRITGTLRKEHMKGVADTFPPAQGYAKDFDYYVIDVEDWRIIDQAAAPWMQEVVAPRSPTKRPATLDPPASP